MNLYGDRIHEIRKLKAIVLEDFNFELVHKAISGMDQKWFLNWNREKKPSLSELKIHAEEMLNAVIKQIETLTSEYQYYFRKSLGFTAGYYGKKYPDLSVAGKLLLRFDVYESALTMEEARQFYPQIEGDEYLHSKIDELYSQIGELRKMLLEKK